MKKVRCKIPEKFRGKTRKYKPFKVWMDKALEKMEERIHGTREYHYDTRDEEMYIYMQEAGFYD